MLCSFIAAVDLLTLYSEELGVKRHRLEISFYVHICLFKDYENSLGSLWGGMEKPCERLSSYRNGDSQRQDFVLAMLAGFRHLDHCLVVTDV